MLKSNLLFSSSLVAAMTLGMWSGLAPSASAQDAASENEVVVTGSHIRGTPEDAALPVDVVSAQELKNIGAPSVTELVRNLPVAQGLIGETNQFDTRGGQASEGSAVINLRGLGSTRTLVLLNGERHVAGDGLGVDIQPIPTNAIGRLEVLKDGAAALYGSDAIGGVVNIITRRNVDGFEVSGSHQFLDGSDGDSEIGVVYGIDGDAFDWMIAAQYSTRSKLQAIDRDWAVLPFAENPQGGWSSIGHPGTFFNAATFASAPDPQCNALGGTNAAGFCRFQFTNFDNLIEETNTLKVYTTADINVGESELHLEALYGDTELPDWNTSPAYPPQSLFGRDRLVLANHPGLVDMFAEPSVCDSAGRSACVLLLRPLCWR